MQNNMTLKLITLLHIYKLFRMIKSRRTKFIYGFLDTYKYTHKSR